MHPAFNIVICLHICIEKFQESSHDFGEGGNEDSEIEKVFTVTH